MKKTFRKILIGLIIAILLIQYHAIVSANEITDLQNEQSNTQKKIDEAKEQKDQVSEEKR